MIIYTVKEGDSVYSIAKKNNTTPSRIITDNNLDNPQKLSIGQTLVLLYPTLTYTVRGGDTLNSIANAYGVSLNQLWRNNPQLAGGNYIYPGQILNIAYETPPLGTVKTNGYAYPYIDRSVLRTTLPYLTYLSIFTYGIRPDGTLIPPTGGDSELIALAREYGTTPLMMLTSLTEEGTFSNELVAGILQNEALADRVIENTLAVLREKGYGGLDVDFEYIPAEYREAYPAFLNKLREQLTPEGYVLFASLAPKSSADQRGLLYEGHDYGAVGNAVDYSLLMTYEWGYQFGPPLAVAPIRNVEEVVRYAVSVIPPEKILLGVPNYGYDWPLPYVKGETEAKGLSTTAAFDLAYQKGATIMFDEESQAPYFNYYDENGKEHVVWFENARSVQARLDLVNKYSLGGISVWQIMRYFPQLYSLLGAEYESL